jgi:hypothetical protein
MTRRRRIYDIGMSSSQLDWEVLRNSLFNAVDLRTVPVAGPVAPGERYRAPELRRL